eukprot:1693036-Rhodomonas_salina.3
MKQKPSLTAVTFPVNVCISPARTPTCVSDTLPQPCIPASSTASCSLAQPRTSRIASLSPERCLSLYHAAMYYAVSVSDMA